MTFPGRWIAISRLCQPNNGGPSVPRGTTTLVAKPGQEFYCERTKCARNSQLMLVQPRGHFWLTKLAYSLLNLRKGSNGLALRAETDSSDNRRIVLDQAYSFCATIASTRQRGSWGLTDTVSAKRRMQPDFSCQIRWRRY